MLMAKAAREVAAAAPAFNREAFSEYHLYALNRKTTLLENETKQISLLGGTGVPVKKLFVVNGQNFYYRNRHAPGSPLKDQVRVFYKFRNSEAAGLWMPMPAGTVRVYQADSKGGVQFAGEDRIDHTPKDEDLTLQIGTAFDVVCERKQTDWAKIADGTYEMAFEITLRNHKATPIAVEVNEPIAGDWRMLTSSHTAHEDRRLGGALRRAGGRQWRGGAALSRPRALVGRGLQYNRASCRGIGGQEAR